MVPFPHSIGVNSLCHIISLHIRSNHSLMLFSPSFSSSGEMLSIPGALFLLRRLMALSSSSLLGGSWLMSISSVGVYEEKSMSSSGSSAFNSPSKYSAHLWRCEASSLITLPLETLIWVALLLDLPIRMFFFWYTSLILVFLEANARSSAIFEYQAFLSFWRLALVCLFRSLHSSSSDALLAFLFLMSSLDWGEIQSVRYLFLWPRCFFAASLTALVKLLHYSLISAISSSSSARAWNLPPIVASKQSKIS